MSKSPLCTGSPTCRSRRTGGTLPGEPCGSTIWPIAATSAGAKRTRMRISRAGSRAVEPGISSGSVRVGRAATAICIALPCKMPRDFCTSSGTRQAVGPPLDQGNPKVGFFRRRVRFAGGVGPGKSSLGQGHAHDRHNHHQQQYPTDQSPPSGKNARLSPVHFFFFFARREIRPLGSGDWPAVMNRLQIAGRGVRWIDIEGGCSHRGQAMRKEGGAGCSYGEHD